jgi:hypothetical protein
MMKSPQVQRPDDLGRTMLEANVAGEQEFWVSA